MSINTLENHVLEMIGENTSSPDVFTDTDDGMALIRESLNDAIEEMAVLTGSYKGIYHMPLVASQGFYRLRFANDDLAWITDVWSVGQKRRLTQTDLIKLSAKNSRWMSHNGSPLEYGFIGSNVFFVTPKPTATSDVLEVTAVMVPKRYTGGADRIKMRNDFKWAAVHYVVSEYYASRGDAESAIDHHRRYLSFLGLQTLYPKASENIPFYKTVKAS